MGAAAGAVALGVGLGLSWPRLGAIWSRAGAVVDADFAGGRYAFAGRNYPDKPAFLAALGGVETDGAVSVGPYAIPGAPEKVVNGDFSAGTASWTGHRGGTIAVAGGICTLSGNGGNLPGFAQALNLAKGHAYQFRGKQRKSSTSGPSWTISSSSELGGANAAHLPDNNTNMHEVASTFSANAATMYVGGRHIENPSNASTEYDDASVKEVLPFAGFVQEGFAAIISGVMPAGPSGDEVIFEASDGGLNLFSGPYELNRVRLVWDGTRHLRLIVTSIGSEVANLDLGVIEALTAFEVLFSVRTNEFRAALLGGPVLADASGDLPGIAKIYLKRQNAGGSTFNGTLDRVTLFPAPWSEAEFYERQAAPWSIAAWGDSLTAGAGASSSAAKYTVVAGAAYTPQRSIVEFGVGGQASTAVAARQGGVPVYLTVADNEIPASGSVAVTARSVGNSNANNAGPITDQGTQVLAGWLAGIYGTLSRDGSWNYAFTRAKSGPVVPCPTLSQFIPELAVKMRSRTQWLWLGRNGVAAGSGRTVEQDIADAATYLGHQRYLVGSILTSTTDNASGVSAIEALNLALASTYAERFVNVLQALKDAHDGGVDDLGDIANGWVPRSMRSDAIHLNDAGYAVVATTFKAANDAMGW